MRSAGEVWEAKADPPRPRAHRDRPPKPSGAGREGREAQAWMGDAGQEREAERASAGRRAARGMADARRPTARAGRGEQASERQRPNAAKGGGARTGGRGKRPLVTPFLGGVIS